MRDYDQVGWPAEPGLVYKDKSKLFTPPMRNAEREKLYEHQRAYMERNRDEWLAMRKRGRDARAKRQVP